MEMPVELKAMVEELAEGIGLRELMGAARGLSERYRSETGRGKRLIGGRTDAAAYAVVRMPATFAAVSAALGHTRDVCAPEVRTVLDAGAGTGAAEWAAAALFGSAERFTCV